jgi:glycosyltransferase involved in cell wall biosynthesis
VKVLLQQFLSRNHSWSIVGQNIARTLIQKGHDVQLFSTNGLQYFPEDLKPNLIGYMDGDNNQVYGKLPENDFNCQISYTAMRNFVQYLSHGTTSRFGIWAYEWDYLPTGWAKYHQQTDFILAPSNWSRERFIKNKIPEHKVKTIHHGMNPKQFENKTKYPLKTKKAVKFLCNVGQSHLRKGIDKMFDAYHKAFTKDDDVCLVAKLYGNNLSQPFEVDPFKIYNDVRSKYKNAPEVELITEYIPDIIELYNVCDVVYSLSLCEAFYLPAAEAIFADKINLCSNYGGQLDFLNKENALLVNGKLVRASRYEQYWGGNSLNQHFEPDINDAVDKLRYVYKNLDKANKELKSNYDDIKKDYTWNKIVDQMLELM